MVWIIHYSMPRCPFLLHDYSSSDVDSNFAPSNSPQSLSFSAGDTSRAMNENVMYGARSGEPQAFTSLSSLP